MTSKALLRAELRARRGAYVAALSPGERRHLLDALRDNLLSVCGHPVTAAGYVAVGGEIDPAPILATLASRGVAIALPRSISVSEPIRFHLAAPNAPLEAGLAGIPQPLADSPAVDPDLVLVPLIAADLHRNRLGQGAGHYDRALATLRARPNCKFIGLAWDVQIVERLPADSWDVPLDLVVTPTRIIG